MTIDIETLRGVGWLAELDEPARFNLANAVEQNFPRGAAIMRAREPARSVFILREGGAKESQTTPEGKEVILALHGPGDLFGDVAALLGDAAPTSVTAMIPTKVLAMSREDWARMLEEQPSLAKSVQQLTARRIIEAWRLVRMLSRYTTEARLKSALVWLAERWGQPREEGIEIALDLTHRTLADLTGASREKVTRALGILGQKGLVRVVQRRLVVPSLDRLHAE
jgi:CRP/FNR family transcriptional regulator